jgi:hypothetical protein
LRLAYRAPPSAGIEKTVTGSAKPRTRIFPTAMSFASGSVNVEESGRFVRAEFAKWATVVRDAKLKDAR